MNADPALSRQTRSFIVLVALLQGGLLYLAQKGIEHGWWPFDALGGRICWYTLVLSVPSLMTLSVVQLRDPRFWQHAGLVAAVFLALAGWATRNATGAPGLRSDEVLGPFGATLALALFVALPWLQCRLAHGRRHAPYSELFEHAWQNALTLALAALFTGLCWAVLHLWGGLFALVEIRFFRELFRQESFIYLATGAMVGLGILIGRTQQRPVQVARQILIAIFTGLLPLLALIALMFVASLPFTGLEPLWKTRSAATLLIGVIAGLAIFANAVYQQGESEPPYPAWLRRVVDAGLLTLPVYAVLALYAMWLRIDQYGWTPERFWAALLAAVATACAFGYAWAALRSLPGAAHRGWLAALQPVNRWLSLAVIALALLANSPLLDPFRISVHSQLQRLADGRTPPDALDLNHLRFDTGRRGYAAAQGLRDDARFAADPERLAELERVLKRTHRWGDHRSEAEKRRSAATTIAEARTRVALAEGTPEPGDGWWRTLLDDRGLAQDCLQPEAECVLLARDLDGDGADEQLLCELGQERGVPCRLAARDGETWSLAGHVQFWPKDDEGQRRIRRALRAGRLTPQVQRWPRLAVDGAQQAVIVEEAARDRREP